MRPPLVFYQSPNTHSWELCTEQLAYGGVRYHAVRVTDKPASPSLCGCSFEPGEIVIYPQNTRGGVCDRLDPVTAAFILLVAERIPQE
jgi:hypothetical protein